MPELIELYTPQWLSTTWNINGILTIFCFFYGLYLVQAKSSKEMLLYKHLLSSIVIYTSWFDIIINFCFRPVALFPLWGGFTDSEVARVCEQFMEYTGILDGDVSYLMPVIQLYLNEAIVSLVTGFLFRFWALQSEAWPLRSLSHFYAMFGLVHIVLGFPCAIVLSLARSPREWMVSYIVEEHPEFIKILNRTQWVIFNVGSRNPWSRVYACCVVINWIVYISIGSICVYNIVNKLNRMKSHMSEKTYQLHRNLLSALCWQSAIPVTMYFIPIGYAIIVVYLGLEGNVREVMNVLFGIMGSHSIINVILMTYFTKPYREFSIQLLNRLGLFKKSSEAEVVKISSLPVLL